MSLRPSAALVLTAAALLAGCAAGPDYQKPQVEVPPAWKIEPPWREAAPRDAQPKGAWWRRYGDVQLDALQERALAGSASLEIAAARLAQVRAQFDVSSAALLPSVNLSGRLARLRISENRPLTNYNARNFSTIQNDAQLTLGVNYEVDLAGRIQRTLEGARATAEQSAADFENARLLLSADLAAAYINLRSTDIELDVLDRSIALQRRTLELVSSRRELGAASGFEQTQQQALLDATLTQVDLLRRSRAVFEHAIATLVGVPAPTFAIAPSTAPLSLPEIPLGQPSDTLERRPDVASAERAMAVANAQVGVVGAGYFPSVVLGPSIGYDSRLFPSLFDAPSMLWSIGLSATQTVFDGGRLKASTAAARAGYDAAVGNYRRVVLTAMQEVEDGITSVAALQRASGQAQVAVNTSRRLLDMASARYEGGATTYLDMINAQQAVLTSERTAAQIGGQRLLASVQLVKALGGDWQDTAAAAAGAAPPVVR